MKPQRIFTTMFKKYIIFLTITVILNSFLVYSSDNYQQLVDELLDINDSKQMNRIIDILKILDKNSQEVITLILEKLEQRSLGISIAIYLWGDEFVEPLINLLHDVKRQQNAADYLQLLGDRALPGLKKYTSHPTYGRIVSQIIEIIDEGYYNTFDSIFNKDEKQEVKPNPELLLQVGHSGGIDKFQVTEDGRYLVTLGNDRIVKTWNIEDFTVLRAIKVSKEKPDDLIYLDSKRWIIVSSDFHIRAWDVDNGKMVREVKINERFVGIQSSYSQKYLIGGTGGNTQLGLGAYDIENNRFMIIDEQFSKPDDTTVDKNGEVIKESDINFFESSFFAEFMPNSEIVVYGNAPTHDFPNSSLRAKSVDLKTGKIDWINYNRKKTPDIVFSSTGNHAIKIDHHFVTVVNPESLEEINTFPTDGYPALIQFKKDRFAVVYSKITKDGKRPGFGDAYLNSYIFIDLKKKTSLKVPCNTDLWRNGFDFIPSKNLYLVLENGNLKFLNLRNNAEVYQIPSTTSPVIAIDINETNTLLAAGFAEDSKIVVWDLDAGRPLLSIDTLFPGIRSLKFIPKTNNLLAISDSGTLELWNIDTSELEKLWVGTFARERALDISGDGNAVVLRGNVREIKIESNRNNLIQLLQRIKAYKFKPTRMTRLGRIITIPTVYLDINILDINSGKVVRQLKQYRYDVTAVKFVNKGKEVLLGGPGWYGKWDVKSGLPVYIIGKKQEKISGYKPDEQTDERSFVVTYESEFYFDFEEDPAKNRAFAVTSKNRIICFDLMNGENVWAVDYQTPGLVTWGNGVTLHPGKNELATAHSDGKIRIWNSENGQLIEILDNVGSEITDISYYHSGRLLLASSLTGSVHAFGATGYQPKLNTFYFKNDEWVTFTNNGYFVSSPEGLNQISWKMENKVYRFSRYSGMLWSEAFIKKVLKEPDRYDLSRSSVVPAPNLRILDHRLAAPGKDQKRYLHIRLQADRPVDKMVITNNGSLIYNDAVQPDQEYKVSLKLPVAPFTNRLVLVGRDSNNMYTNLQYLSVEIPGSEKGKNNLYLLGVAVDEFYDSKRLMFPSRDVKDLFKIFTSSSANHRQWNLKEPVVLSNDQVTNKNIMNHLKRLPFMVMPRDTVVIYFSGHGFQDLRNNSLYFVTRDESKKSDASISLEEIFQSIEKINAAVIVFLDMCHAGAAQENIRNISVDSIVESMMKRKFTTPLVIFSSKGRQWAIESPNMENSIFAHSLIKGLMGKADVYPEDKIITLSELYRYIKRETGKLSDNRQSPYIPFLDYHPDYELLYLK